MSQEAANLLRSIRKVGDRYDRIEAGPNAKGLCERSLPEEVRAEFLREDQLWEARGKVLKPGSRSAVTEIEVGGVRYVLKQYKCMVLRRRLRYALTRTRSMQSWEQGQLMAELGLPVSRPVAILIERKCGIPARSKLLMESVSGTSIKDVAEMEDGPSRLEAARPYIEKFFERLKECHLTHGDLSGSNVILDEENRPQFIDLDGSRYIRSEAGIRRKNGEDRASFMKNWRKNPEVAAIFEGM